jgi:hypothetical protein
MAEPARLARRCATARSPGGGEQENEREAEDEWRRPCSGDAEGRHGHGAHVRASGRYRPRARRQASRLADTKLVAHSTTAAPAHSIHPVAAAVAQRDKLAL